MLRIIVHTFGQHLFPVTRSCLFHGILQQPVPNVRVPFTSLRTCYLLSFYCSVTVGICLNLSTLFSSLFPSHSTAAALQLQYLLGIARTGTFVCRLCNQFALKKGKNKNRIYIYPATGVCANSLLATSAANMCAYNELCEIANISAVAFATFNVCALS